MLFFVNGNRQISTLSTRERENVHGIRELFLFVLRVLPNLRLDKKVSRIFCDDWIAERYPKVIVMARTNKRAESRARYFTRKVAEEKGWDIRHPQRGGDCLEEQEVSAFLSDTSLGLNRPDFVLCLRGNPVVVIETKNDFKKYREAIDEAVEYCNIINTTGRYNIKIAIGVAGEDDNGYIVIVKYYKEGDWVYLTSKGNALTAIISKQECINALSSDDSTTELTIPSSAEFIDAAIEVSNILRTAKIETTLRPKVVGAITTALYYGDIDISTKDILGDINKMAASAINESEHFSNQKKKLLIEAIKLGENEFNRLSPYAFRIISILKRLNVKAVLQSDADFLGMFYEAFLRYGADNNAMGIVFTPRHITRLCVDMVGVEIGDLVIDITCGTGGFLVSAFDALKRESLNDQSRELARVSVYGFDTNPTVWALSCLNMFFRGDGKSHIEPVSSLDEKSKAAVKGKFKRAFLNPPFHQENEPERDFIDASMQALMQGGLFAGVIYAGVFADEENSSWRAKFMREHTILGMISLPDELFYPNASAITTIMIARAHYPQPEGSKIFIGRISNDGYEKLKGKRVECAGSQIPYIKESFKKFLQGEEPNNEYAVCVPSELLKNGAEYSPQQYLPQAQLTNSDIDKINNNTLMSLFKAVTSFPDITDSLYEDFSIPEKKKNLPLNKKEKLSYFFEVSTGKSAGLKGYTSGIVPYVSSGDNTNGIVGLVTENSTELCDGCITVSAFGTAYLQPWKYMARGNGGSSVRVLVPKYNMTIRELFWFIAQINSQKWRFTYARQAIKRRLEKLEVVSPEKRLVDPIDITKRIGDFKNRLSELSVL